MLGQQAQRALATPAPEAAGLVEHLGHLTQGEEVVGKAHWHPELLLVGGAEFSTITEGIAALAHDIKGMLRLLGWRPPVETPSG